ncbi:hypothetical protein ACUOA8_40410, partial [Escherichia sp. SS-MK2]
RLLQRVLLLMKKHYTEERMARILGPDNDIELVSFRGSDLSGGEDMNIVQGSSLPEMKSAQQDRIMTLWDKGAIVKKDGSPDPQALLKLMEKLKDFWILRNLLKLFIFHLRFILIQLLHFK